MACTDCKICTLISSDVLCLYTPLKGIALNSINSVVDSTNQYIIDITGTCDICENYDDTNKYQYTELIAQDVFHRFYAQLVYYYWLQDYGTGRPSKEGIVSKQDDEEFSGFRVHSQSEIKGRIAAQLEKVKRSETKFLKYFKENHSACVQEIIATDCCSTCGNTTCTCNNKYQTTIDMAVL